MIIPTVADMDEYFAKLSADPFAEMAADFAKQDEENRAWEAMMTRNEERAEVVLDDDIDMPDEDDGLTYETRRGE